MYRVKDKVSHPGHGACEVSDLCELDFTGERQEYYRLVPMMQADAIVYIPVCRADDMGLRSLISENEADQLMASLQSTTEQWMPDALAKQRRYKLLFADNKKETLYETMSALSAIIKRRTVKELGSVDKAMLSTLQNKALSEVALAKGISFEAAVKQAEDMILCG